MSLRIVPFALAATVATLGTAATASAQPALYAQAQERHGLFAGGGLWGGNISCEGTECGDFRSAGGANGQLGYMFGPNFGLVLDVWAMTSGENDVAITYVASTLNARLYLAPRLWVQAGVGNGHAIVAIGPFAGRGDDVPVGQLAAGAELVRGDNWSLDLSAKVAAGTSTDGDEINTGRMAGVGLTMTWFSRRPAVHSGMMASR
jgi:hypothetical protein